MRARRSLSLTFRQSCRRVGAVALHWLLIVWFALSSMGFPLSGLSSTTQPETQACAVNPGSQCRCSLKKKLAGSCCCKQQPMAKQTARESAVARPASCCAKPSPAKSACCAKSKVTPAKESSRPAASRILAIESCDCGPEADHDRMNHPLPRLLVTKVIVSIAWPTSLWIAPLSERGQGDRIEPPTPPPRPAVA